MDPKTIGTWIGVVVAAGGVIAGAVKFAFWTFDEWQRRRSHEGFSAPKETLSIALKPEGNCWWAMGKMGDDPTMQIVGRMFVTNVCSKPVRIPQAKLRYGFLGRKQVYGMVSVSRGLRESMHGMYDIPPEETRDLSFDFWIYPPVAEPSNSFIAHSVVFLDQFGNQHEVRRVAFKSMQPNLMNATKEPEEFPYQIPDPVEKEVVSVLKAEMGRYRMNGRIAGGLGSVHFFYQGRMVASTGGDSWNSNSPLNQLIVNDPEEAALKSDTVEALSRFYGGLDTDEKRAHFIDALLQRLDGKKGYLSVSYFIVAALHSVGHLSAALQKAKADLPVGEQKVFGLSNVLMLLNGLLKYRHSDLTNQMLDDIERMTHDLNEHLFLIPEKLAAIRASRLSA